MVPERLLSRSGTKRPGSCPDRPVERFVRSPDTPPAATPRRRCVSVFGRTPGPRNGRANHPTARAGSLWRQLTRPIADTARRHGSAAATIELRVHGRRSRAGQGQNGCDRHRPGRLAGLVQGRSGVWPRRAAAAKPRGGAMRGADRRQCFRRSLRPYGANNPRPTGSSGPPAREEPRGDGQSAESPAVAARPPALGTVETAARVQPPPRRQIVARAQKNPPEAPCDAAKVETSDGGDRPMRNRLPAAATRAQRDGREERHRRSRRWSGPTRIVLP